MPVAAFPAWRSLGPMTMLSRIERLFVPVNNEEEIAFMVESLKNYGQYISNK